MLREPEFKHLAWNKFNSALSSHVPLEREISHSSQSLLLKLASKRRVFAQRAQVFAGELIGNAGNETRYGTRSNDQNRIQKMREMRELVRGKK